MIYTPPHFQCPPLLKEALGQADREITVVSSDGIAFQVARSKLVANSIWFADQLPPAPTPPADARPCYGVQKIVLCGRYRDSAASLSLFISSITSEPVTSIITCPSLFEELDGLRDGIDFAKTYGCSKMQTELEGYLAHVMRIWTDSLRYMSRDDSGFETHSTKLGWTTTRVIPELDAEYVSLASPPQESSIQPQPPALFGVTIWGCDKWERRAKGFGWCSSSASGEENGSSCSSSDSSEDEMFYRSRGSRFSSPATSEESWSSCR